MSRRLSPVEKAIWLVDQEVRQNFVMIARISHPLGAITELNLRKSLDLVQEKYPPLKWKIKGEDVPEFVSRNVPAIPLRIIERKDDRHWLEVAEEEMDEAFPFTEGPLVRVVLLASKDNSDMLVSFCHIASDATSGVTVVKKILTYLGRLSRGETVAPEPPLPPSPSSVEALKKDLEFKTADSEDSDHLIQVNNKSVELTPDVDVPPEKRVTRIIHRMLSVSETSHLADRCKTENTSVHGALCSAFLQAVAEQTRCSAKVPEKGPVLLSCITAVNMRPLCPNLQEEDIGYYISFAVHHQLIDEKASFWNAARDIKEAVKREVESGRDIEAILGIGEALKEFSSPIDLVRAIHNSNPPVAVTNLGRLDLPHRYGDLILEALHFPVAIHFDTKNGLAIAVTTFQGRMTINLLYAEPFISEKRATIITENMMKRLKEAIIL